VKSVSVIVPVWNCERFLAAALKSVYAQNHPKIELIVIDDASTDSSVAIAKQQGATVLEQTHNQGAAAARNRGLEVAQGDLIAFLDADDLWAEHKLHKQLAALEQHPELMGVGSYVEAFGQDFSQSSVVLETFLPCLGTAIFFRDVFTKVGVLDETFKMAEDLDWFLRLRDLHIPFALLPEPLLRYLSHENNTTKNRSKVDPWTLRALAKRHKRHMGNPPRLAEVKIL
jgi:glycosyltransferase involved in cell wall biosynthesis